MRSTFGSTVFRVFDKVIVAILVLLMLIYVAVAVIRVPAEAINREDVAKLKASVLAKQKRSSHTAKPLTEDYLSAAVGAFRPDLAPFEMRLGPGVMPPHTYPEQALKRIAQGPAIPAPFKVNAEHAGIEIRVADKKIVKAAWDAGKNRKGIVLLVPLWTGTQDPEKTEVELINKKGHVVAIIPVLTTAELQPPTIFPPKVAAQHIQRKVRIMLSKSLTIDAVVTEYAIFKGESPDKLEPFARIIMPDGAGPKAGPKAEPKAEPNAGPKADPKAGPEADPKAKPSVVRADGKPGGTVEVLPNGLALIDSDVDGGVRYSYAAEASGRSTQKDRETLKSLRSKPPVSVNVPEAFEIKFYTLSPDNVTVIVSVVHALPVGGGLRVERAFGRGVVRGQAVGWKIAELKVPGQKDKLKNVDFSTGYQILDIVNEERAPAPQARNAREREEKRQKLLLINERGRIKVLWRSVR